MNLTKPTIGGAIASITKGIKQLEAVIAASGKNVESANSAIDEAQAKRQAALIESERAARIKAKLEELVA